MDEGERKEEPSVPPDYVSLAQLQERWLQKQEEKKLKEREEEERKLKEKEEEESDARAERGKNQSRRGVKNDGRAKIEGGFVRDKGLIEDRGKGKVMAIDGPENRGENNNRRGGRRGGFQKVAAVGVAGDGGVLREEGGIVEICSACVVEVLPVNGVKEEIRDVKRTNLRGGLRGNGRRVDEMEESEMALGFERKVEGERGRGGRIWRERNGGNQRRLNLLEEFRPAVSEKKGEDGVSRVFHEISSLSIGDGNGIRGRNNKGGEDRVDSVEGECSTGVEIEKADNEVIAGEGARIGGNKGTVKDKGYRRNGNRRGDFGEERRNTKTGISAEEDRIEGEVEIEKKVDLEVLSGESEKIGEKKGGAKGYRKKKNQKRGFGQERRNTRLEISAEVGSIQEEGSNGNKVDHEVLDGESARLGEKKGVVKGYRKSKNRRDFGQERRYTGSEISAEEGRVEEEGSNGNKVDHEVLDGESARLGEKKGYRKSKNRRDFGQERRYTRSEISAEEGRVEEEGSNGNKVDHEVLDGESARLGEKKGYRKSKNRRDFGQERRYTRSGISAEEGRVEEEGSNGNKVALVIEKKVVSVEEEGSNGNKVVVEIEKKVDAEVLNEESEPLGEKKGTLKGYRRIENERGDFGQERRHPRLENKGIVNGYSRNGYRREGFCRERRKTRRGETNSGENGMVWVKKEEKFGA